MTRIWERQPKESSQAYEAFVTYRDLGAGRTLIDVARELRKSYSLVRRWADAANWSARAAAWDNYVSEKAADKAAEDYASMIDLQINIGKMLQAKAAKALQKIDFENVSERSLPALVRMIESGVDIERSAREIGAEKNPRKDTTITIVSRTSREDLFGGEANA